MSANVLDEERLSLSQAAKLLPGRVPGEAVTRQSVRRWCAVGVLLNGVRVKLDASRVGHTWWTSKEAVQRFVDVLSGRGAPTAPTAPTAEPPRTPAAATRASKRAAAALIRRGV